MAFDSNIDNKKFMEFLEPKIHHQAFDRSSSSTLKYCRHIFVVLGRFEDY